MRIRYIGPLVDGALLAVTGDVVYPGDELDVETDLGITCCEQVTNWQPADDDARATMDKFYEWVALHERDPRTGDWRVKRAGAADTEPAPEDSAAPAAKPAPRSKPRANSGGNS